jgi:hypothetical protein
LVPDGAVIPIFMRSSSRARSTGWSVKQRQDRREAISCTKTDVSYFPGGSHFSSVVKVLYRDISSSIAVTRIASRGHTAAQCPQKIDSPPETAAFPSMSEMVPVGQMVTHNPQPSQISLSISILFSSIAVSSYDNTAVKSFPIFLFSGEELCECEKQ